ncbi:MAG TPA: class I SAM-dependent methyltransferase [Polyangiaceae bacterium]|jgi:SAM-dependent methyltransferase|nr:class I SAM-dependent methyltransferase [Polyangiaceae bacterium]
MPTIAENRNVWTQYEWSGQGDEWSSVWGGTSFLWWGMLYPRLHGFLPAKSVLEIAPGFGRCTQFLARFSERLVVVDLNQRCIDACRERFRDSPHLEYHVNDGRSLDMVKDGSVDFAFSYDSLVHAEGDVLDDYVSELGKKLAPDGIAFIHHSNLGAFVDPKTGALPFENAHWRATTMSASRLESRCAATDLACVGQELLTWGGPHLSDCFSLLTRRGSRWARENTIRENIGFMDEAKSIASMASLYRLG